MTLKPSFKERQFAVREETILEVTLRLLGSKGYELTTMDEVAAEVGIAKASLYKHFPSKEALACAVMRQLLEGTLAFMATIDTQTAPMDALRTLLRWALQQRLAGVLPSLPSNHSGLRDALLADAAYLSALAHLTGQLTAWIEQARARSELPPNLPTQVILLSFYARTCDPTIEYLRLTGNMSNESIIEVMLSVFFEGIRAR